MSWWRETVTARWCQTNNMISKQMMTQSWALPSLHNSLSAPVLMSMLFSSFTYGLIISWTQMHECFSTVVFTFLLSYIMVSGPNASSEGEASSALRSKDLLSQRLLLAATGSNKKSWTADAFKSYTTIRGAGPRWSSNPDHLPSSWAQPIYQLSFLWNCLTQGQYCGGVSRASTCMPALPHGHRFEFQLFHRSSSLLTHLGKQQQMAPSLCPTHTWENQNKFLVQTSPGQAIWESEPASRRHFSLTLLFK